MCRAGTGGSLHRALREGRERLDRGGMAGLGDGLATGFMHLRMGADDRLEDRRRQTTTRDGQSQIRRRHDVREHVGVRTEDQTPVPGLQIGVSGFVRLCAALCASSRYPPATFMACAHDWLVLPTLGRVQPFSECRYDILVVDA